MRIFSFLRKKRHRAERAERLERLTSQGYEFIYGGYLPSGKLLISGYTVKMPDGSVLDNHGLGFASRNEAMSAVRKHINKMQDA